MNYSPQGRKESDVTELLTHTHTHTCLFWFIFPLNRSLLGMFYLK